VLPRLIRVAGIRTLGIHREPPQRFIMDLLATLESHALRTRAAQA
jgi:hypothetical protein